MSTFAVGRSRKSAVAVALSVGALILGLVQFPALAQLQAHSVVVSDDPADWTPHVLDGRVNAVLQVGDTVIVGGTFTQQEEAGPPGGVENQPYLFAFDSTSGDIDTGFTPELDSSVEALAPAPDGESVFVGGDFLNVNGSEHHRLVRIDLSTGDADNQFNADANGLVQDLAMRNDQLYVSGKFTVIDGDARSGMARLDPEQGTVDPDFDIPFTQPPQATMGVPEFDITADGSRLIAIGNFSNVDGENRVQIAMLDLTTDPVSVANWQTNEFPVLNPLNPDLNWCQSNFPSWLRGVDFSPDGSYFVVGTTGANRPKRLCDTVSRWETSATGSGLRPSWVNWMGGDSILSVAATGAAVYIGGHNNWVNNPYVDQDCGVCANPYPGAIRREGIAALDPLNGLPYTWNPGRTRGLGVMQFLSTEEGMWVASDTDRLGDEIHPKLGFFPVDGGTVIEPNVPYTLPGTLYNMDLETGSLLRRTYDFNTFGATEELPLGIDWRLSRGAFALNGKLYTGWSNGKLFVRTFDGFDVGAAEEIDLNGLEVAPEFHTFFIPGTTIPVPAFTDHLKKMTGMFFDNARIYYTVRGDKRLYYRYFTPESLTVGANLFVASTGDGVPWAKVRGMTLASGKLVFANGAGNLFQVDFDGKPVGVKEQIGGPLLDGVDWASRGFFAFD